MADYFEAKWFVSVDDVVATFRMIYEQTGGGTSPEAARSAGAAIQAHQLTALRGMMGEGARVEALYTRKINPPSIPAWMGNFNNAVGTASGQALHAQQALLINLRNTDGELKRSGRVFIPGMTDSGLTDGIVDATMLSGPVTWYLDTLIDIPAGGTDNWEGQLRVERNQVDGVVLENPIYVVVDAVDATEVLGTQHRRKGELRGYMNPAGPA